MRSINRALALSAAFLITAAAGSANAAGRLEGNGVTQQQTHAALPASEPARDIDGALYARRCRHETTKPFKCRPKHTEPAIASTAR